MNEFFGADEPVINPERRDGSEPRDDDVRFGREILADEALRDKLSEEARLLVELLGENHE